jgi:hypothetical protein
MQAPLRAFPKHRSKLRSARLLTDSHGQRIASGKLPAIDIPQGKLTPLGTIRLPLAAIAAPDKLTLSLTLPTGYGQAVNYHNIWVYPAQHKSPVRPNVVVCNAWDSHARDALAAGKRVLLMPKGTPPGTIPGGFATDFWCWPMFHSKPGTMGLLCDPAHPALAGFPTESHSNWQWANVACAARPVILDATPADYRPIVQVVDNLDRNHKLGLLFEARVGPGRLLVLACDLPSLVDKPEARQLFDSLLDYAE